MDKGSMVDTEAAPNGQQAPVETEEFKRNAGLTIHGRIHAVMQEVGHIAKDAVHEIRKEGKKVGQFDYITHDAVTALIRPAFIKHGIMVLPNIEADAKDGNRTQLNVSVAFVNVDNPDDRIVVNSIGYGVDNSDKGPGKAFSYAVKYAYLKLLMLNSADDIEVSMIDHDPDQPRASQKQEMEGKSTEEREAWAINLKAAIEGAKTVAEVDALQKANKRPLMEVPDATRDYFITLIQGRKTALETPA